MKEKIIAGFFILLGCAMLLIAVSPLWENRVNENKLVQVEATVTKVHWAKGNHNNSSVGRWVRGYAMEWPEIYVSYELQGKKFSNVRLAEYRYSAYEGQIVTVYCDPSDSAIVATAESMQWSSLGWIILGGLLIGVGVRQILEDKT